MERYHEKLDKHISEIVLSKEDVVGEIYLVTNTVTGQKYVGQTRSHRKNRGKYRPFGYLKRFDDHVSNAKCKSKGKLTYFHNAIRKYGDENFSVELVIRCSLKELDDFETEYVKKFNTLYPNGYNLTTGGTKKYIPLRVVTPDLYEPIKSRSINKSEATKKKISMSLKRVHDDDKMRELYSKKALDQHMESRCNRFKGLVIDKTNLEQYIKLRNSKKLGQFYKVKVGDVCTSFSSTFFTIHQLREQAIEFLSNL